MATAQAIINRAYRRHLRVTGIGRSPSSAMATEGLDALNSWLNQLVGYGGSLPFRDVPVDSAYTISTAWPAVRVQCQHGGPITITLPEGNQWRPVQDGFRVAIVDASGAAATNNITIARNGWKIAGAAANATVSANNDSRIYMFRGDLGDWKLAADLELATALPFPAEFDEAVALILADRLAGGFGQELSRRDQELRELGEDRLRAKYCRPPPADFGSEAANIGVANSGIQGSLNDFLNGIE